MTAWISAPSTSSWPERRDCWPARSTPSPEAARSSRSRRSSPSACPRCKPTSPTPWRCAPGTSAAPPASAPICGHSVTVSRGWPRCRLWAVSPDRSSWSSPAATRSMPSCPSSSWAPARCWSCRIRCAGGCGARAGPLGTPAPRPWPGPARAPACRCSAASSWPPSTAGSSGLGWASCCWPSSGCCSTTHWCA